MYMEMDLAFELEKNVLELKSRSLKTGRTKLKPLPKEPPNKFKTELTLKVLLKKNNNTTPVITVNPSDHF